MISDRCVSIAGIINKTNFIISMFTTEIEAINKTGLWINIDAKNVTISEAKHPVIVSRSWGTFKQKLGEGRHAAFTSIKDIHQLENQRKNLNIYEMEIWAH
ncbi:hypothetical protein RF11_03304 [Thelohanellus kitauei]|uniref:Uncharacterized protein n=1 Tax=Thelohanellus kitauei TaxID=669202 RepID=A0A0C2MNF3_THEKT|nr:hypothetical protein RF11_03304 [Thelohanellus kitauei]